tara:strand:- start:301 stop:708 length:408 start_codon:yes stop_codon:yes gene_type:complete
MFKLNNIKLVQIFVNELLSVYTDLQAARSAESEGGRTITRGEVWDLLTDFICDLAPKLENAILAKNALNPVSKLRWEMIKMLAQELKNLPDELDRVKSENSEGGTQITKQEAVEVITNILQSAIPKIITKAENKL